MVSKGAQVLFGIWIKPVIKQLGDNFPFNSQERAAMSIIWSRRL